MTSRFDPIRGRRRPVASTAGRAFTLVEVMIVIAIIAVLAALVTPHYWGVQETAEETAVRRQLQVIRGQIEVFRSESDGSDPDMTSWTDLLEADLMVAAPRNAMNDSDDIATAGDFAGGWVWRDDGGGKMQIYATNADHTAEFVE
jgi:prepilin-type N-terminal cleavage/methylation domain-containing protein